MKTKCLLLAVLLLSGCATSVPVAQTAVCPTKRAISDQQESAMGQALMSVPFSNPLRAIMAPDWVRMRDEIEACRKVK